MKLALILILAVVLRIIGLGQSFWLDEAAQVIESARPLSEQLSIAGDFQPPFFHILLHFWMYAGHSEAWIRLLPLLFGVFTVYVTYLTARHLFNEKVGLLSAFLLSISPFHVWYSQEARPYALATLLSVLSVYFLIRKKWFLYTLISIGFLYSIYLAPFLFIAQGFFVYLFYKGELKTWAKSMLVVVLSFLPWLPSFLTQLGIGTSLTTTLPGWGDAVSVAPLKALPLTFAKFMVGRITFDNKVVYAAIVGVLGLAYFYSSWHLYTQQRKKLFQLGVFILVPLITTFLVTLFIPILAPQRILFILPFMLIILAAGLSAHKYKNTLLGIFILISTYSMWLYVTNTRYQREQWRQSVAYVEGNRTANSKAVFLFPDAFAPWQWYNGGVVESVAIAPHFVVNEVDLSAFEVSLSNADKLFYFHYLADLTDPHKLSIKRIQELGFSETETKDFPGVGFITVYEKAFAYR